MPDITNNLPPPVNHIFVDYENVHHVDAAIIGGKNVHFTLLLGVQKAKLDVSVVEKLLLHAATVEWVRLKHSGPNAVDFALAYYVGRAVIADPCGHFHIVSKDKGYDALIEHLRSKHIHARRHENFATLTFSVPKPSVPPVHPKKLMATNPHSSVNKSLSHTQPKTKLTAVPSQTKKTNTPEPLDLIEELRLAGRLNSGSKSKVS